MMQPGVFPEGAAKAGKNRKTMEKRWIPERLNTKPESLRIKNSILQGPTDSEYI